MHMKNAREDYLAQRVEELRAELLRRDPAVLAANIGASFDGSQIMLHFWGQTISVTSADFVGRDQQTSQSLNGLAQALLAYHLHTADGTLPSGNWIAFSGLPDGQFYSTAFQGYTGNELAKGFGNALDLFQETAVRLGGRPDTLGDAAYSFSVFPLVPILAVGWAGDEDFAPSYRLLFDSNVSHHLPTDACAILGSTLTRRLLKEALKIDGPEVGGEGFSP